MGRFKGVRKGVKAFDYADEEELRIGLDEFVILSNAGLGPSIWN